MKRILAIVLVGGILTLAMQLEILARGGGGRGGGGGGGRRTWRWRWRCCAFRWRIFSLGRSLALTESQREHSACLGGSVSSLRPKREHSTGVAGSVTSLCPEREHTAEPRRWPSGCLSTGRKSPVHSTRCGPPRERYPASRCRGRTAPRRPAAERRIALPEAVQPRVS